ncbi:hypothetical protein [Parasediminibacterium sp. JCM 36343]|uniref:hypothetical protein n=1 Tax=Parasediminibacterium sp. JCM 36343 TaxID=3374279 RepID=UPI0039790EF2
MGIHKIFHSPREYLIPNFCFEKKFSKYLFLESNMLNSEKENSELFFQLLNCLCEIINNRYLGTKWVLLIPFDQVWNFTGYHKVNESNQFYNNIDLIKKELTYHRSIEELSDYFEIFCSNMSKKNGTFRFQFNQLVPIFWLAFEDKIAIYASNNEEVIIIGIDTESDLREITNDINLKPFLYDSSDEYLDFWKQLVSGRISRDKITTFENFFRSNDII